MRNKIVNALVMSGIPGHTHGFPQAVDSLMELFREEVEAGAKGQVNRFVGAPVGADGSQRKCPKCEGYGKLISKTMGRVYVCLDCDGTGAVEDTSLPGRAENEPEPESRGSPPLGPRGKEREALNVEDYEEVWDIIYCTTGEAEHMGWTNEFLREEMARRLDGEGYEISRTSDGERSEHSGPNKQLTTLAENKHAL